jgi:hypothetical protein
MKTLFNSSLNGKLMRRVRFRIFVKYLKNALYIFKFAIENLTCNLDHPFNIISGNFSLNSTVSSRWMPQREPHLPQCHRGRFIRNDADPGSNLAGPRSAR